MHKWEFFAELHCLNLGILGPATTDSKVQGSIDSALGLLSPEDRRKTTRKARKLMRKRLKARWKLLKPSSRRNSLASQMIYEAWKAQAGATLLENDDDV